jgi:hypothetical protein
MTREARDPAFPLASDITKDDTFHHGLTSRQYAAIKLRVPHSGAKWLDEMIIESLRDDFALSIINESLAVCQTNESAAKNAYKVANAILEARK